MKILYLSPFHQLKHDNIFRLVLFIPIIIIYSFKYEEKLHIQMLNGL